jgi:N-acetylmuramoyl-L-alanine amidase
MLPFAYYLLKIAICSAVLFGYYWFALRNKVFHGYNRFYLLAIVGLSLTLPLCRINIFQEKNTAQTSVIKMLQVVTASDEYMDEVVIAMPQKPNFSLIELLPFLYLLVSVVLFVMLIQMLLSIFALWKNGKRIKIEQIHFINTDAAKGTPFSFFKYIFWNQQIDMHSPAGNRIFKHELAHIQERHSWDKMFINLVLILFWSNPIFWLIRRELSMIHEFIADKRAVEDGDTAAFASMILAATYPQHQNFITNNFFYSPIKRRLMMLTKNKNLKVNYASRLLVLPLLIIVFTAFTIKAKEYKEQQLTQKEIAAQNVNLLNKKDIKNVDVEKQTDKIASTDNTQTLTNKQIIVVLDAGHGGTDPGVTNKDGLTEKDLALQLVKRIKAANTNENIKIILTRETDMFQNVKEKAAFANEHNADLFISVHLDNTSKEKWNTVSGLKVYISKDGSPNTEKSKPLASAIIASFKNNYGIEVAPSPQQREAGIWVLDANNFPSIIIEAGYLTNDGDAAYLLSKKGQETFANNVLNAINTFSNNYNLSVTNGEVIYTPKDSLGIYKGKVIIGLEVNPKINLVTLTFRDKTKKVISLKEATNAGINLPSPPPTTPRKNNSNIETNPKQAGGSIITQNKDNIVFTKVEHEPEFIGGQEEWRKYLQKNINPNIPNEEGWKDGTYKVIVNFIVEKDGTINQVTAENYSNSRTAQHCIALIKNGPKWKPAIQNGYIVAAYKKQPITFVVIEKDEDLKSTMVIDPVFRIGNLTQGRIKADEFKSQKFATVTDGYEFVSCGVYFGGTGFQKVEATNLNGKDFTKLNALLEKCTAGTSITFTNIRVKNKDGLRTIEEKSYILY